VISDQISYERSSPYTLSGGPPTERILCVVTDRFSIGVGLCVMAIEETSSARRMIAVTTCFFIS
jgi:hypothetical protein